MAHDTEPTAEYVKKFAEERLTDFSGQVDLDRRLRDAYNKTAPLTVAEPAQVAGKAPPPRAVRSGFVGLTVDMDVAMISDPPYLRFNSTKATEANQTHANDVSFRYRLQ